MKRLFLLLIACFCFINAQAAYLRNVPKTVTQPDGTILQCFASGDEYFNYLHDENGFTIMRHPTTGYYVYAEKRDGKLVATDIIAGRQDPASKGLEPYALISPEEWIARRKAWEVPDERPRNREANHGTLNNIGIFIRFSDDPELTNSYTSIDNMFNDLSDNAVSLRNYFKSASYGSIDIPTTFYPGHNGDIVISYQDTQPRSYFEPYSSTNTNGYDGDDDRTEREHALLARAVEYINTNYPIPTNLNIDYDNDGYVDNICFIVKGGVGEWSSLLWPHMWSLYTRSVYINGKRVGTFNFQLADATSYFNTSTMCHEMNHSLGAPDLYHYYNGTVLSPVGPWDLMENNATPPQHCGAYMKMKYGHWVDDIPEITQPGVYTLNPISSDEPTNIAYKIASSDPNQFYVLEYRDNTSLFETSLPGSGLLIYRIDDRFGGNASYDPNNGIYDEVYLFRPNGTTSANGNLSSAYFSYNSGRTEFSASTNPYPFLTDGTVDSEFRIYDITAAGNTISFTYGGASTLCDPPTNVAATVNDGIIYLSWNEATNAQSYNVYRNGELIGNTTGTTYTDNGVSIGVYSYYLKSVDSEGLQSGASETVTVSIVPDGYVFIGDGGSTSNDYLPSYSYYNYSLTQQIFTSEELGLAGTINSIAFYNEGAEKTRSFDFYMKNTTKNAFSSNTDWVSVTNSDKVFSGSVTMKANQWNTITLSTPFNYDGTSNLILFADDNSGEWTQSPHMSCRVFDASNQAIQVYSDYTDFDPKSPPTSYTSNDHADMLSVKNQIILQKDNVLPEYVITVSANPSAGGTVSGGGSYTQGTSCTLSANANPGYTFTEWIKDGIQVSTSDKITFIVSENAEYVAVFTINSYEVTATVNPTVGGTITGAGTYNYGTTCTLTATANEHYEFTNWKKDGSVVSTSPTYTFTVTAAGTYVANFNALSPHSVTCNPTENGTISANPTTAYKYETVMLTATPASGYFFSAWDVRDASNHSITVTDNEFTMPDSDVMVSATFVPGYNVTLAAAMNGSIAASPMGGPAGTTITLTATPDAGYILHSWVVYKTGDLNTTVTVSGNTFTMPAYDVTVVGIFTEPQGGDVTIGSGTTTTNGNSLPTNVYYNYSLTQQVYTADELGDAANIIAISFYYNSTTDSDARSLQIYMSHTGSPTITAWSTVTNSQLVYSGSHTFTQGWNTLTLATPFTYNGTSNILLTVDDNSGTYSSTSSYFRTYSTGANRAVYYRNNSTNPDPTGSVTVTASKIKYNAQMIVTKAIPSSEGYLCVSPDDLTGFEAVNGISASEPQSVAVIGANLQSDVTVTMPSGYEVSASSTGDYSGTMTLTPSDGSLLQTLYVRLASNADTGDCNGTMTLASDNTTASVSLSGTVSVGIQQYAITVTANPTNGGTVSGGGSYSENSTCTLTATAAEGYTFTSWTENGEEVSTDAIYSFTVTGERSLQANFSLPTQTYTLPVGWSWWSANVEITLSELEEAIGANGINIMSQIGPVDYIPGLGWDGAFSTLDLSQMYQINMAENADVVVSGPAADPADHPVTVNKGWTWIGYPVRQTMTVNAALAGLTPANNDQIQAKTGFALYNGTGWIGSLNSMEPGQGYMYNSKADGSKTFTYPSNSRGGIVEPNVTDENNFWKANPERFANNMSVLAVVEIDGVEATDDNIEIGAFVGDECRGSIRLMHIDGTGRHLAFLTIHGETGEAVSFRVLDGTEIRELDEKITFHVNDMLGNLQSPFVLHASSEELSLFPNPANRDERIHVTLPASIEAADARVEVYNALGALVGSFQLNGNSELEGLHTTGMYTVKVTDRNGNVDFVKLVVK